MGFWNKLFKPPSKDDFARRMMRAVRAAGSPDEVDYEPAEFRLRKRGSETNILYLTNAYNDFLRASRSEKRKVLTSYASLWLTPVDTQPEYSSVKGDILPRIRERFYHESIRLHSQKEETKAPYFSMPTRAFSDDLTLELVCDYPDRIATIAEKALADWGVSFEDALAVAKDNLWKKSNADFVRLGTGLYHSPWQDTHDASRLYLHDLIWQLKVKGTPVAMVPNRNHLLVTGSEDIDGLTKMAAIAEEIMAQPRCMTGIAVSLQGKKWAPYLPPPESAAHWPMKRVAMRSIAQDYAQQTSMLEAIHEKNRQDIFVAKHSLLQKPDGTMWTWTSWVGGVADALMPAADWIAFGRTTPTSLARDGFAKWENVARTLPHLMRVTEDYPRRYQIREFPSPAQLAELNLQPVPE